MWIAVLNQFQNLETFLGSSLWKTGVPTGLPLETFIAEIAQACPKLREIEHWEEDEDRRIIIERDDSGIRWSVQSPPIR